VLLIFNGVSPNFLIIETSFDQTEDPNEVLNLQCCFSIAPTWITNMNQLRALKWWLWAN